MFFKLGKTTLAEVSTEVFKVNLNSAPILMRVVSIAVVTFCAKSAVERRKKSMYAIFFIDAF
jgi:hypothetical protein